MKSEKSVRRQPKNRIPTTGALGLPAGIKDFAPDALVYSDGLYRLLYGARSFPFGFRKCAIVSSENLLEFSSPSDVLRPKFGGLASIGAGSAIARNGKTAYLYIKKSPFTHSLRLMTTTEFSVYEQYPLPVLKRKDLPKKCRGLGAPRVFVCGEQYYLVFGTALNRGGQALVYRSPNLIDWNYRGAFGCETSGGKFDFVSLAQIGSRHYFFANRIKKQGGVFGYRVGSARPDSGSFTPFSPFRALDEVLSPRIASLPDGRTILTAGLPLLTGGCASLALPKEIVPDETGAIRLKPTRELENRRADEAGAAFLCGGVVTEIPDICGNDLELNVFADLSAARSFTVRLLMTGCRGLFITFDKESGTATFDASTLLNKRKNRGIFRLPYGGGMLLDLQIFLFSDRFEIFLNGGEITVSRGIDTRFAGGQIGFDSEGDVPCEIVKFSIQ